MNGFRQIDARGIWAGERDALRVFARAFHDDCQGNREICHYFPDMVREAIAEARSYIRGMNDLPYIRESAA